jgi:hypothetical protein
MSLLRRRPPIERYCEWLTFTVQSDIKYVPKKWREKGGRELSEADVENLLGDYLNFYVAYTDRRLALILSDYGREVIGGGVASRCIDWEIVTITAGEVTPTDPRYPSIFQALSDGLASTKANLAPFPEVAPEGAPKEGSLFWAFGHFVAHKYAQPTDEYFAFVPQQVAKTAARHRLHLKQFLRSLRTLPSEPLIG